MSGSKSIMRRNSQVWNIALSPVFFLAVFLYIGKGINPALIYQGQDPIFFFDGTFFKHHLELPGGMADYLGAFLTQFFIRSWLGALSITAVLLAVYFVSRRFLVKLDIAPDSVLLPIIPVIFALMLHSDYEYPVSVTLGFLFALGIFTLAVPQSGARRVLLTVGLALPLYYLAAGALHLYLLLCLVYEFRSGNRWTLRLTVLILYPAIALALPYITADYISMVTLRYAYLHTLPFETGPAPAVVSALLYLYPVILLLADALVRRSRSLLSSPEKGNRTISWTATTLGLKNRNPVSLAVQAVLIYALAAAAALVSFKNDYHHFHLINFYAYNRMWIPLLKHVEQQDTQNEVLMFQINRALYHTGRLAGEMFSYPQPRGAGGLFIPPDVRHLTTRQNCDFYLELGNVNEAQRWAHEGLSQKVETPWVLQRLVQTCLLNADYEFAEKCLNRLDQTLFHKEWAKKQRRFLPGESNRSAERLVKPSTVESDFVRTTSDPESMLKAIFENSENNRMAFEYLMACYLMQAKIGRFISLVERLPELGYDDIPRHYEEAIMLYMVDTGNRDIHLPGYVLSAETMKNYAEFQNIVRQHNKNMMMARDALRSKFAGTYWYYLIYERPRETESEGA